MKRLAVNSVEGTGEERQKDLSHGEFEERAVLGSFQWH
jgi:hypothetical protein